MTRELKLALILGSSLVLVVGVLISDHLSGARQARIERVDSPLVTQPVTQVPPLASATHAADTIIPQMLDYPSLDPATQPPTTALGDPAPVTAQQIAQSNDPQSELDRLAAQFGFKLEPVPVAAQTDRIETPEDVAVLTMRDARAGGPGDSPAANSSETGAVRTTEYTVQSGDTLWSLAARFLGSGSRHAELKELNKGRLGPNGELRLGLKILVPGATNAGRTNEQAAPQRDATPEKKPTTPSRTYTVKAGDTLHKIAEKTLGSGNRWRDIFEANKSTMKDSNTLRVGAVLKIPTR